MTDQPPPPPGNYPPPPPPPGGYPPPPPPQGGGYPPPPPGGGFPPPQAAVGYPPPAAAGGPALPQDAYTPWQTRVLAWLIDAIPLAIIEGIGWGLLLGTQESACITDTSEYNLGEFCATGASTIGQISIAITAILALAYWIWNLGYRQGTTGSSIGKSIMKFKIVNEKTGQPVGFGMSVVRELIYWVGAGLCFGILWLVAVLFPLWDPKRQTLVDKILTHIALPL
jgi:uncharacterized RDD family membrane protein YckC